jgi:glycosyltransferase involved in cell wall biosynthesis
MIPAVSVIIPLFNADRFIAATLQSLQRQTMPDFEAIIVDDGSSDGSVRHVEAVASIDHRFQLVRQANAGVSITRNRGVELAKSDIIAFLDADDLWHPDFLRHMLAFMAARPDTAVGFAGVRFVDAQAAPTGAFSRHHRRALSVKDFLAGNPTTTCSNLVVRSAAFQASGGFRSGLNHAEDQLWLLEMHLKGFIIEGTPDVLVDYRTNNAGLSSDTRAMAKGWDELARHALNISPHSVRRALPSARAANQLYLAQRALRTRRDIRTAFHHGLKALQSHTPTVAAEVARIASKAARRLLLKG